MATRWKSFEDQVRDIAAHVFGKTCSPGRLAGRDIDGIIDIDKDTVVLIEITVDHTVAKIAGDVNKLVSVRSALFLENKFAKCFIVTQKPPTHSMITTAENNNISAQSVAELAASFIEYERYRTSRLDYPFGSAVNPESGEKDNNKYVPVQYYDKKYGKSYSHKDIADKLLSGQNVVVMGEYGSGKSRCVAEVFDTISKEWGATFKFPVAVNLGRVDKRLQP